MFKLSFKDVIYLIVYAIPNTIFSFGILYIINNVISGNERFLANYMGIVFVSVIGFAYLLNIIFQKKLNKYAYRILYRNEINVFEKMLKTPLLSLERLGSERFYGVVQDIKAFEYLPAVVTNTINSLLMLVLCMIYMFTLSVSSALVVVAIMMVLAGIYLFVISTMTKRILRLREYHETYFKYVDDVIKGFKELKLSFTRRENLLKKYLVPNREKAEDLEFKLNYTFLSINIISQYGLYFGIGIVLFTLPQIGLLDQTDVISYVVILLFIAGPVNLLINMQSEFTKFSAGRKRIQKFLSDFNTQEVDAPPQDFGKDEEFHSLELKDISFAYENKNAEKTFALGPINLTIKKGETIFVVGGNGSGKSTFVNILTSLYKPSEGDILLNGVAIDKNKPSKLQKLMTAVFTNNHIFSHNYDNYTLQNSTTYLELIKMMKLEEVVTDDSEESARRGFSKGQGKRMSLIFALLENRSIMILDEWAADQDPHFRKYFYEVLIPKLKEAGKTIIAVTHDDAYFKHADRIIKFDYGKIVKDVKAENGQLATENLWT